MLYSLVWFPDLHAQSLIGKINEQMITHPTAAATISLMFTAVDMTTTGKWMHHELAFQTVVLY